MVRLIQLLQKHMHNMQAKIITQQTQEQLRILSLCLQEMVLHSWDIQTNKLLTAIQTQQQMQAISHIQTEHFLLQKIGILRLQQLCMLFGKTIL